MDARYVFRVRFRLSPDDPGVSLDPDIFETTLYREADEPGEDGWLFFRDNLWRGDVNDAEHVGRLAEETMDVPVESVTFRALDTDEEYFAALKSEIAQELDQFKADDVTEVVSKYLGSSVELRSDDGE